MTAHKTFKVSGRCRIDERTVRQHEIECEHCDGTGKVLDESVVQLCRRWRESLGLSQWDVATMAKATKSSISKFETGQRKYSEKFKRRVVRVLSTFAELFEKEQGGVNGCSIKDLG